MTRFYLDIAITHIPEMVQRLQEDMPIMRDVVFDSGIKKIQP